MPTRKAPAIDIPEVDIVTVTPDLAERWLASNSHNRPLRRRAVIDYARDMAAGHWLQNGEAIKFAADGTLLDGQHRLHAVVASGAHVVMLVVSGLPGPDVTCHVSHQLSLPAREFHRSPYRPAAWVQVAGRAALTQPLT